MKNKITLGVFLLLMIASMFLIGKVNVNYDLEKYLPDDSNIKLGLDAYQDEFGESSQATFSFGETDIGNALDLKQEIVDIEHVKSVVFLDDYLNEATYQLVLANLTPMVASLLDSTMNNLIQSGLSFTEAFVQIVGYMPADVKADFEETISQFVSEDEMMMQVVFDTKSSDMATETAINEIKSLLDNLDYEYYFAGNAISTIFTRNTIEKEVLIITLISIPLILAVLLVMSRSYFDIILFGITVGVAIIINLGTNALLPDISFITQSMAIALQLAISLDYVIFMLSAYHQERRDGSDADTALQQAKKKTMNPIIASALTTGFSFLALIFMRFSIGLDIGLVFGKAIVISLITTITLLPILIKTFSRVLDKTQKTSKSLFKGNIAKKLFKFRYYFLALLLVVLGGSIYFQTQNNYSYGAASFAGAKGTSYQVDLAHIEDEFGAKNTMTLMVNKDDLLEGALYQNLASLDYVDDVKAGIYYKSLTADEQVLSALTAGLYSENYALIQFNLLTDIESDEAFTHYEDILAILEDSGFNQYYIFGETAIAYNIKDTVEFDYNMVLIIALALIMIVILITFKNVLLPILLPLVIETSVMFTMALLLFLNSSVVFLASLIVSAILLGVTIDYAILLSKGYMMEREEHDKKTSIQLAIQHSAPSIVTSALLFSIAGFTISIISSITTISQIGLIIAVGAITSLFYVLVILPQMLTIFDKWIHRSKITKRD